MKDLKMAAFAATGFFMFLQPRWTQGQEPQKAPEQEQEQKQEQAQPAPKAEGQRVEFKNDHARLIFVWDDSAQKGDADFAAFVDSLRKELDASFQAGRVFGYVSLKLHLNAKKTFKRVEANTGKTETNLFNCFNQTLPGAGEEEKSKAFIAVILGGLPPNAK